MQIYARYEIPTTYIYAKYAPVHLYAKYATYAKYALSTLLSPDQQFPTGPSAYF